ncbi:uncharacterized protein LOC132114148 [Carassius carassius]|uniref:uncharacterized protein LOC132114148 n=1 Tax=Carassius carassius TaxID=217509 RepID=UPI0028693A18|nr:uncharacterized protein LOC132114148 [Carassius carassius]
MEELHRDLEEIMADLEEMQSEEAVKTPPKKQKRKKIDHKLRWKKRDQEEFLVYEKHKPKKDRSGKPVASTIVSSSNPQEVELETASTSEASTSKQHFGDVDAQQIVDLQLQQLQNAMECDEPRSAASHDWALRQTLSEERWEEARPKLLDSLLASDCVHYGPCDHCSLKQAVIRCKDYFPKPRYCGQCDVSMHQHLVFHNRETLIDGFYKPLPPSTAVQDLSDQNVIYEQVCLLPITQPDKICDCDPQNLAVVAGRSVVLICINGCYDVFLPVMNCRACLASWTPEVVDLLFSGYWPGTGEFQTIYKVDLFTSFEDLKITAPGLSRQAFVKMLQQRSQQFGRVHGKGICGTSTWAAARETSKKTNTKCDEEGLEVAVCRHSILLRGLNMFRGEIFAYPLFLQKELATKTNCKFFCTDIMCRYWPYLQKVAQAFPEMQNLTQMKPFLSVMHAKGHSTKCEVQWGGKNQTGAGTTIGEEVEQVNSFLSRVALTTKYMSKAARVDMITLHARGWNERKERNLHKYLSTRYLKVSKK